ncbi:partial N-acetyl-alpha-D-glucosaminyl L-malate synthase, partial [Candidatus Brocadiaceae bacterium]
MRKRKVAYIVSRFPHLPETFILREMEELESQGWEVALYPIINQSPKIVHATAKLWLARVHRMAYFSSDTIAANSLTLIQRPLKYGELFSRSIWENRTSSKFLTRAVALFPKAIYAASVMRREGIEHIHAHYATHPALAAWIINCLTGIPYSVTVHAHDIFVRREMLATKLRNASFVVAISEFNREYLARSVGSWVREKTHVIHCGIRPTDYISRAFTYSREQRFEILNVASLQPYKGQTYLIDACALLRDRGISFRCRIVGGGENRQLLERQIAQFKLEDQVELLGPLPQESVASILPTAHCYVQPSIVTPSGKMEGIPVAIMEAMAVGLPVVATSISGIPEIVRSGETGWLVPPADAKALADALAGMSENLEPSRLLAQAGRALVLKEFN